MKLYLLTQDVETGLDTYDSVIVAAKDENDAARITPSNKDIKSQGLWFGDWPKDIKDIKVELIGTAKKGTKRGVILASFNAG